MPEVTAKARYVRISPRKVREVVDVVRGLTAEEALRQLDHIPREAAIPVEKLIRSAVANAEHNAMLEKDSLRIRKFTVDGGPSLKRYRPRAYGRAVPIHHRSSHITVVLEGAKANVSKKPKPEKDSEPTLAPVQEETETVQSNQREFEVKKKVGQERKPSFVKKIFRRKSI